MKTLASVLEKLTIEALDLPYIYLSIMRVHSKLFFFRCRLKLLMICLGLNNDCQGALEFWEELVSEGGFISKEISTTLYNLLVKNKYDVPKNLEAQAQ